MPDPTPLERLVLLAAAMLFRDDFPDVDDDVMDRLQAHASEVWDRLPDDLQAQMKRVRKDVDDPVEDNPDWFQDRWLAALIRAWLISRARDAGLDLADMGPDLEGVPEPVRHAAARMAADVATDNDRELIDRWLTNPTPDNPQEDTTMPDPEFAVDEQNLEPGVAERLRKAVADRFQVREDHEGPTRNAHQAHVVGTLLISSYLDPTVPGFEDAFVDVYEAGFLRVDRLKGTETRRETYARTAEEIAKIKGGGSVYVQELATVADGVIDRGPTDDNFVAKVRNVHGDYVGKTPIYDSLNLPGVITDDTAQAEVEPVNIRSVAMIYAATELERAGLFMTCDLAAQDWTDGVLPVGEAAGRLFDTYVWGASDRLDPAARQIQSDRIADLDRHLVQFCSALSERDRSQYLSEYLGGSTRSAQPRDAAVRKAARDLLAFASLHGWAYAQFAAKRLGNQIRECVGIIDSPEVQKAYGVQGPWQLVERVTAMAPGGQIPNVPKHRTLGASGKDLLDLLATKAKSIAASSSDQPLFDLARPSAPAATTARPPAGSGAVFNQGEYEKLVVLAENWLAARGVNDKQRMEASQIRESKAVGSLPSIGGFGGGMTGGGGVDTNAVRDQLMNMVSAGQMPTADQLDQLFRMGG